MSFYQKILTPILLLGALLTLHTDGYCSDDTTFVAAAIYPNPFRNQLTIEHNKCIDLLQEVAIYDAIGNNVYIFSRDEYLEKAMTWDGNNQNGSSVNSGTYICHIRTNQKTESFLIQKQ